jgi:hypothetical protein
MYWKDSEKVQRSLKYLCKMKDAKLYLQLKTHHDKFVKDKWVTDLIHEFDSSKSEPFNEFLTKFLLKKKHYCWTICHQGRM